MAIEKRTYPTRLVIALGDDGAVRGVHVEESEAFVEDGEVAVVRELGPRPLGETEFADVLGPALGVTMATNDAHLAALAAEIERADQAEAALALAQRDLEGAARDAAAARERHGAQVAELEARVDEAGGLLFKDDSRAAETAATAAAPAPSK